MIKKTRLRVFEHQKLYYSTDGPFQEVHWKALCDFAEHHGESYFSVLAKGVKFSNYVGVIQADKLTIEILPKIDARPTTAINCEWDPENREMRLWHEVLLQMLWECKHIETAPSNKAFLRLHNYDLLDIYVFYFLEATDKLLREGLIKRYRKQKSNQNCLKGQLIFPRQLAQNIVHQERFFVEHTVYDKDNLVNQLLFKCLNVLKKITTDSFLSDFINRTLFSFPEISDIHVTEDVFSRIVIDRKTERYKDALLLSKMILLNYNPDISGGGENVVAILFDMNKLWEKFTYVRLKKLEKVYGIKVSGQQRQKFWTSSSGRSSHSIRPDIVIDYYERGEDKRTIIDTKWKRLENFRPSDADLKQMFVYNLHWKCDRSVLLYPGFDATSVSGNYSLKMDEDNENSCSLAQISVLNENGSLNEDFGNELLQLILPTVPQQI